MYFFKTMARTKQKPKVKGRFSKDKMRGVVKAKNRRTAAQAQAQAHAESRSTLKTRLPPKGKTRQKASSHEAETLNKWKKETMQKAVEEYRASRLPGGTPVSHNKTGSVPFLEFKLLQTPPPVIILSF